MSGLVKELLLDYSLNRLTTEQNCDFYAAIVNGLRSKSFTPLDIRLLNAYLSGYTDEEIAVRFSMIRDDVIDSLSRTIKIIEEYTQYTDIFFITHCEQKYSKKKLEKLQLFLEEHGKHFHSHVIEGTKTNVSG